MGRRGSRAFCGWALFQLGVFTLYESMSHAICVRAFSFGLTTRTDVYHAIEYVAMRPAGRCGSHTHMSYRFLSVAQYPYESSQEYSCLEEIVTEMLHTVGYTHSEITAGPNPCRATSCCCSSSR